MRNEWFDRIVDEAAQLTKNIRKLREFRKSPGFASISEESRKLLDEQYQAMVTYCMVLNERIGLEIDDGA